MQDITRLVIKVVAIATIVTLAGIGIAKTVPGALDRMAVRRVQEKHLIDPVVITTEKPVIDPSGLDEINKKLDQLKS